MIKQSTLLVLFAVPFVDAEPLVFAQIGCDDGSSSAFSESTTAVDIPVPARE